MPRVASVAAIARLIYCVAAALQGSSAAAASPKDLPVFEIAAGDVALGSGSPAARGKVDIFIDLACPVSAAAWPKLWHMAWEFGSRVDFTFHIFPLTDSQGARDAAKVVQVMFAHFGSSSEVLLFIDRVFGDQAFIFADHEDDTPRRTVLELLTEWAFAGGGMTMDEFESDMEDPALDARMADGLERSKVFGVRQTPSAILNNAFVMFLAGNVELQHLWLFVEVGTDAMSTGFDDDDRNMSSGPGTIRKAEEAYSSSSDHLGHVDAGPYAVM